MFFCVGGFRSSVDDTFSYAMRQAPISMSMAPPTRITRSVAGGGYPPRMRIAPSQDDFVLTRTIRNPTAAVSYGGGGGGGMRSDYHFDRSPPQSRVAPNVQYGGSHASYNRRYGIRTLKSAVE